ncbi:diacetyl reductase [Psittacicella melopsittaci]|uniref:diacetyl reductase [(S)-acetoin forming] n=1 Tax=Psittacicella melopsittaci TaxID=2028576 RepID=A0A3A1Y7X3_9GAMM|nr:acetoin reductase [Psittacicella melopsittaci]RIY32194.1 diacetyl reductase [Psittacicella melopsittaci]
MSQKVAVITGSAGGLGKAIALRLAEDGFAIVLHDINKELLSITHNEFTEKGYRVTAVTGDVRKKEDQENLVQKAVEAFGSVDVFINNAGIESVEPFELITSEKFDLVFDVNVKGVVFGTQAAAAVMKNQATGGKIINACSIAGHESYEMLSLYCASKHAVRSFTHSTAKELSKYNITVNAYCPGVAATAMWDRIDQAFVDHNGWEPKQAWNTFTKDILVGRPQVPDDVAKLVSFLASSDSDYITGQTILTDGGMVFR